MVEASSRPAPSSSPRRRGLKAPVSAAARRFSSGAGNLLALHPKRPVSLSFRPARPYHPVGNRGRTMGTDRLVGAAIYAAGVGC